MIKEIEIDTNINNKYDVEGIITFSGRIKTDKIHTTLNEEGLINQFKTLTLDNLLDLINAKEGDRVKIFIEKL